MAETKYGKYILREPQVERWAKLNNSISVNSNLISGINVDFAFLYANKAAVDAPRGKGHPSHKHPVNEYLYFIGGDPNNILDSDFELEIFLGEGKDRERHIVNSTSVVYIPAGLAHLPMRFTKIGKPVLCGHLLTQGIYEETQLGDEIGEIKESTDTKYGKYILREPQVERWAKLNNSISVNSNLNSGINLDFAYLYANKAAVDAPRGKGHPSHKHPVNEYLYFIGGDPNNILDSDFELEIFLGEGEDRERHLVNSTSVVYIPAGLAHLPMRFTKIGKPVLCGHLLTQGIYEETQLA